MDFKLEKVFLFLAILIGFMIIVLTPPLAAPDENIHFFTAEQLSRGSLVPEIKDGHIGYYAPQNIMDFINEYKSKYVGRLDVKQTFVSYYFDSWLFENRNNTELIFVPNMPLAPHHRFGYVFSAFGILVGKYALTMFASDAATPYNLLLFGRIFNLFIYVMICFFAIKMTPCYKNTMFMLALMPMSIFLSSSFSYDATLISVSFLMFAFIMQRLKDAENYLITNKDILLALFIVIIFVDIKQVCVPLLILFLLVPAKNFLNRSRYFGVIGIFGFAAIAVYLVPELLYKFNLSPYYPIAKEHIVLQKEYLFSHPIIFIDIIANSFSKLHSFYLTSFFGSLGELDTNFPLPITACFYIVFLIVIIGDCCVAGNLGWRYKILTIIAVFVCVAGMFINMYFTWTSIPGIGTIGMDYVTGIQGRYFIPLFLFVVALFSNSLVKSKFILPINRKLYEISTMVAVLCGISTILTLLLRFWV